MLFQLFGILAVSLLLAEARIWNNTGVGSIIFEEAVSLPNLPPALGAGNAPPGTSFSRSEVSSLTSTGVTPAQLDANLADIHVQRLNYMNQAAVDYSSYSRLHFLPIRTVSGLGTTTFYYPLFSRDNLATLRSFPDE
jgi:hypothetical protein